VLRNRLEIEAYGSSRDPSRVITFPALSNFHKLFPLLPSLLLIWNGKGEGARICKGG
jgi:hypothetical protein